MGDNMWTKTFTNEFNRCKVGNEGTSVPKRKEKSRVNNLASKGFVVVGVSKKKSSSSLKRKRNQKDDNIQELVDLTRVRVDNIQQSMQKDVSERETVSYCIRILEGYTCFSVRTRLAAAEALKDDMNQALFMAFNSLFHIFCLGEETRLGWIELQGSKIPENVYMQHFDN
ncbi:hypothetical protein QJS10_CPA10g00670 [Acorus calamus]|uniref:Uncharacterized protein n=1 Tax=Acorus calamus TaxID=4465 RepID=A0AAV9E245_ACOCL|nr:hypothetical protein QJS10_CPA10g00670 [Acorus calamus]